MDPADALIEVTSADDFRTVLWPLPVANERRRLGCPARSLGLGSVLLGGSDAGAHLDRMLGIALSHPVPGRHPPGSSPGARSNGQSS